MAPTSKWRPLLPTDIPALLSIADEIHPELPESAEVFLDRVDRYPVGCFALGLGAADPTTPGNEDEKRMVGYAISHPIRRGELPELNSVLPSQPGRDEEGFGEEKCYYIHDIAVLPSYQGQGLAGVCIRQLLDHAEESRYRTTCLVSVYGTEGFWGRFGFGRVDSLSEELDERKEGVWERLRGKVQGYGQGAVYLERVNQLG